MSIVDRTARPVNSRTVYDSAKPCRRGFFGSAEINGDPIVWGLMEEMGYPPVNIRAALSWIQHRGCVDGCPAVEQEDWFLINCAALDPHAEAMAWTFTPSPATAYHPTLEETAWAAAAFAR